MFSSCCATKRGKDQKKTISTTSPRSSPGNENGTMSTRQNNNVEDSTGPDSRSPQTNRTFSPIGSWGPPSPKTLQAVAEEKELSALEQQSVASHSHECFDEDYERTRRASTKTWDYGWHGEPVEVQLKMRQRAQDAKRTLRKEAVMRRMMGLETPCEGNRCGASPRASTHKSSPQHRSTHKSSAAEEEDRFMGGGTSRNEKTIVTKDGREMTEHGYLKNQLRSLQEKRNDPGTVRGYPVTSDGTLPYDYDSSRHIINDLDTGSPRNNYTYDASEFWGSSEDGDSEGGHGGEGGDEDEGYVDRHHFPRHPDDLHPCYENAVHHYGQKHRVFYEQHQDIDLRPVAPVGLELAHEDDEFRDGERDNIDNFIVDYYGYQPRVDESRFNREYHRLFAQPVASSERFEALPNVVSNIIPRQHYRYNPYEDSNALLDLQQMPGTLNSNQMRQFYQPFDSYND